MEKQEKDFLLGHVLQLFVMFASAIRKHRTGRPQKVPFQSS